MNADMCTCACTTISFREVLVDPVEHPRVHLRGTGKTDTERDVVKTGDSASSKMPSMVVRKR